MGMRSCWQTVETQEIAILYKYLLTLPSLISPIGTRLVLPNNDAGYVLSIRPILDLSLRL